MNTLTYSHTNHLKLLEELQELLNTQCNDKNYNTAIGPYGKSGSLGKLAQHTLGFYRCLFKQIQVEDKISFHNRKRNIGDENLQTHRGDIKEIIQNINENHGSMHEHVFNMVAEIDKNKFFEISLECILQRVFTHTQLHLENMYFALEGLNSTLLENINEINGTQELTAITTVGKNLEKDVIGLQTILLNINENKFTYTKDSISISEICQQILNEFNQLFPEQIIDISKWNYNQTKIHISTLQNKLNTLCNSIDNETMSKLDEFYTYINHKNALLGMLMYQYFGKKVSIGIASSTLDKRRAQ